MADIACAFSTLAAEIFILVGGYHIVKAFNDPEKKSWKKGKKAYIIGQHHIAYQYYFNATLIHNQRLDKKIYKCQLKAQKARIKLNYQKVNKYMDKAQRLEASKFPLPLLGQNHYDICFNQIDAATIPRPHNTNVYNNTAYTVFYLNEPTWDPDYMNRINHFGDTQPNENPTENNERGYHIDAEDVKPTKENAKVKTVT